MALCKGVVGLDYSVDYSAIEALCEKNGTRFERNCRLAPYTTMKIGGDCDIMVTPESETALAEILRACFSNNIRVFVLGRGSNVLVSGNGFRGCVVHIGKGLGGVSVNGSIVTAGAGAALSDVCAAALEHGLSGLEFAYGIPGMVGGAMRMNAGAFGGEMKDVALKCRCVDENGCFKELKAAEMELGYRSSIFAKTELWVVSADFTLVPCEKEKIKARMEELLQRRRDRQPLEYPSCGSTFKRPKVGFAAALIEECGLKGYSVGGAQVSEKHSGFVINKNNATFEDVTTLVEYIKKTVLERKGVELECEMLILE